MEKWKPTILYGQIKGKVPHLFYYFQRKKYYGTIEELKLVQIEISDSYPRNNWYRKIDDHIEIKIKDGTIFKIDTEQLGRVKEKMWHKRNNLIYNQTYGKNRKRTHLIDFITSEPGKYQHKGNIFDFRKSNLERRRREGNIWTKSLIPDDEWKDLCKEYKKCKDSNRDNNSPEGKNIARYSQGGKNISRCSQGGKNIPRCSHKEKTEIKKYEITKDMYKIIDYVISKLDKYKDFQLPDYQNYEIYRDFYNLIKSTSDRIESISTGSKIASNYMTFTMMQATHRKESMTIFDVWNNRNSMVRLIRASLSLSMDKLAFNWLYNLYGLEFYRVGNFSPLAARNIYNLLCPKGGRVLDFCSGYGGRLLGYYASKNPIEYIGIDPNTALIKPYTQIITWLRNYFPKPEKKIEMISACAEDVDYRKYGKFDLIFTSPPYFNTEQYSQDTTQSYLRYPERENWMNNFLLKVMEKVKKCLKDNGKIAINIKFKPEMERMFLDGCKSLGLKRKENMIYKLSSRPNTKNKGEPIYIFTLI